MTTDFDHKHHARQRRLKKLQDMRDNISYADRIVPSGTQYKRSMKHKPRTPYEWEEMEF